MNATPRGGVPARAGLAASAYKAAASARAARRLDPPSVPAGDRPPLGDKSPDKATLLSSPALRTPSPRAAAEYRNHAPRHAPTPTESWFPNARAESFLGSFPWLNI